MRQARRLLATCAARLALLAGLLACGGKAESGRGTNPSPGAARPAPAAAQPAAPASARPLPGGPPIEALSPPLAPAAPPPTISVETNDYDDAVVEILMTFCGACHGPAATIEASGGVRFIDNIDRLVAIGWIVPLSSRSSPIIRVNLQGSMPPVGSGLRLMDDASLQTLATFIDNPLYWPGSPPDQAVDAGVAPPDVDAGADGGRGPT